MPCPVARQLLKAYHRTSLAFREASDVILTDMRPDDPRFEAARAVMSTANEAVIAAHKEYWAHVRNHRCRNRVKPGNQRQIDERLRREMLLARGIFDDAVEKHDYLCNLSEDLGGAPDGGLAYTEAKHVRIRACTLYLEALRRYADHALMGYTDEEPKASAATPLKPN